MQLFITQYNYPHVAILLADANCDPWTVEEFQLDEQFLTTGSSDDAELWSRDQSDSTRWTVKNSDDYFFVARVVPLIELKSDHDLRDRILAPLVHEMEAMVRLAIGGKA